MQTSSESESDYDTAVDLVHYTTNTTDYVLSTPAGLTLKVKVQETWTSHSYLEPDFDHLEQTGECLYVHHTDADLAPTLPTKSVRVSLRRLPEVYALTVQDYERRALHQAGSLDTRELTFEQELRVYDDEQPPEETIELLAMPETLLAAIQGLTRGQVLWVAQRWPCFAQMLRTYDEQAIQTRQANTSRRLHSRANRYLFDLRQWRLAQERKFQVFHG